MSALRLCYGGAGAGSGAGGRPVRAVAPASGRAGPQVAARGGGQSAGPGWDRGAARRPPGCIRTRSRGVFARSPESRSPRCGCGLRALGGGSLTVTDPGLAHGVVGVGGADPPRGPDAPHCRGPRCRCAPGRGVDRGRAPGHRRTVAKLLQANGFSLQANAKTVEGGQHPTGTASSATSTIRPARISRPGSR